MWDIWHCNSTGVYGGVFSGRNGDSADTSNLNNTFLHGLQPSDSDGVAQFDSIFPGHYAGRCTHMHVVFHLKGTIPENGTYSGGSIAHIGQAFFDQDLISQVESLSPYNQNTIAVTENVNDRVVQAEVANNADPFLNYVLLGDDVSDGRVLGNTFNFLLDGCRNLSLYGGIVTLEYELEIRYDSGMRFGKCRAFEKSIKLISREIPGCVFRYWTCDG